VGREIDPAKAGWQFEPNSPLRNLAQKLCGSVISARFSIVETIHDDKVADGRFPTPSQDTRETFEKRSFLF
jgi:hypothetical protein